MNLTLYEKRKRLKALQLSETSINIDEMIQLASEKLNPIIETLIDNGSEHFLSIEEFKDASVAADVIKEICRVLLHADFKLSTKNLNFDLDKPKITPNDQGKIYLETGLLLQLIDLYNILEDAKDTVDEFYRSIGIHSFVQTESSTSLCSEEPSNPNKIVLRLTKPLTESNSSLVFLPKTFIVMPSASYASKDDLRGSKSATSASLRSNDSSIKRVRSTGSLDCEETSEITDVYGAKRVVVKCICDLQEVSKYLGIKRRDAATVCSRVEVDTVPTSSNRKTDDSIKSEKTSKKHDGDQTSGEGCCCSDCLGSSSGLQECDDDRVIICIKGCNEDEGDVQIVIRQCPDCKKGEGSSGTQSKKNMERKSKPLIEEDKSSTSIRSNVSISSSQSKTDRKGEKRGRKEDRRDSQRKPKKEESSKAESDSLHSEDSQGSYVRSEEEEEDFKPKREYLPSKDTDSISSDTQRSLPTRRNAVRSKTSNTQQQSRVECSKIRMFETTNLCLETDTGQELVISVTITPKDFENKKLSLRDIFSEDDDSARQDQRSDRSDPPPEDRAKYKRRNINSESKKSLSVGKSSQSSYYVEDRVIPLGRTKICSSVDFDVTTLQTRIRDKGIRHNNGKIVVQLRELGIDNLLRACRPAKCCRKAVLNEKMKKCLPYPVSLRSLPLDDDDIKVINQSLQMSLQKVKKSTNLKKDFYTNYAHSIKPISTIMYFFVEHSKDIRKPANKNDLVRQKLSFYINLVNDVEFGTESKYDILYFGVEGSSNKNLSEIVKKNPDKLNQNIQTMNNGKGTAIKEPRKEKFNRREDRPMLTGYSNLGENDSFSFEQDSKLMKNHCCPLNNNKQMQKNPRKGAFVSKIPIYTGSNRRKSFYFENTYNIDQIEKEVYGISFDSLPREPGILENNNLCTDLGPKASISSKEKLTSGQEISQPNKIIQQLEYRTLLSKSIGSSKYSLLSNYVIKKTRKKKKSFYLSRSKSDISLKTLKNKCKHRVISTQTKDFPKKLLKKKFNSDDNQNDISSLSDVVERKDSSKVILNYFSKMLYHMIVKETLNDNRLESMTRRKTCEKSYSEKTENKSLYQLYKRLSTKNNRYINNFEIHSFEANSIHHDLKAKTSQSCMVVASKTTKTNLCVLNNLAMQTSVLFGIDGHCQTSNSLLNYLIQPSQMKHEDVPYLQKKRIFKKIYNSEALTGIPDSCDQLEKFIVIFRSDHSLRSNASGNTDFISLASECSERSFENNPGQTISNSLMKLKDTLEKYETVKSEIAQGSLPEATVNPIEYFVYQMCACNKFNKKPSVMQKILSKSKGLFSSVEKELSNKYKHQREFFSMSAADRQRLCHQCGCFISKCTGNIQSDKKSSDSSSFCQCPSENKPKKTPPQPCCKTPFKTTNNLSKITSASISSVKSLKTYFKNSLSNIKSRSKDKKLGPCFCDKETTTKKSEVVCIPEGVNLVPCPKKDTSTFTTKDSTTQKCECQKCKNFADDGTCCCSHCLGCLDKSFDAKPDNNNIGTLCNCPDERVSTDGSKGKGDVVHKDISSVNSIKPSDKQESSEGTKDVNGNVSNTDKSSDTVSANKVSNSNLATKIALEDNKESHKSGSNSPEKDSSKENSVQSPSANQRSQEEITSPGNPEGSSEVINHDATAYYVLTSSPNMFSQFGRRSGNPFAPYLLNFPHINMLRLENSQTFLND